MSKLVIDELVVSIGLDPSQFKGASKEVEQTLEKTKDNVKKLGETADKSGKQTADVNKKSAESFGIVTKEIFKLTAAFLGLSAIKSAVSEITKMDSALGRFGRNLNLKPGEIRAFEGVAKQFNISAEQMDAAFENSANIIAQYQTQGIIDPKFMEGLGRAQIDYAKFLSASTDDVHRFLMVQEALNKAIDSGRMTRMGAISIGGMMGYDPQVVTMMIETKGHLEEMVEAYKKLNDVTKEDTHLSDVRNKAWAAFTGEIEHAWRASINGITKFLLAIPDAITPAPGSSRATGGGGQNKHEAHPRAWDSSRGTAGHDFSTRVSVGKIRIPVSGRATGGGGQNKQEAITPTSTAETQTKPKKFGYKDLAAYVADNSTSAPPPFNYDLTWSGPVSAKDAALIAQSNRYLKHNNTSTNNSNSTTTINIAKVELPNVKDSNDFIATSRNLTNLMNNNSVVAGMQ